MPLPDAYLTYAARTHGMDNPHYGWDPVDRRAPRTLAGGTKAIVSIIVPVEFFPLNPPAEPFKHPGAMKTPYPDLRHYTVRDYGNRVGVFRLLRAFADAGVSATFAVNAEAARRYSALIDAIAGAGHEIAAHGVSTAHIHHDGLSEADERALIADTRAAFPDAKTWMSPARNTSYRTLDLIAQAGFTATLDWEADMRPIDLATPSGPVTALPNYSELGDMKLLDDRKQSEEAWAAQILEAVSFQADRYAQEGSGALAFTMTPYIAGQPFRLSAVRYILNQLNAMPDIALRPASESAEMFKAAA